MNQEESGYANSVAGSLQGWVNQTTGNALSFVINAMSNLADLGKGLFGALTGQGEQSYDGFLNQQKETDAKCVETNSGAEAAYHVAEQTTKASSEQTLAASIGTAAAQFVADSASALLNWMTTLGVGSSDSNGDGYVTGADSTFAGSARRTSENDSQYGCDLTVAQADYSDALNRNEIDFTTSNGAVQNSLVSDIVAAQLQFEKDVIAELNKLSLKKAEAERDRAIEIATQQKQNAVAAVHQEYGDFLTEPFDPLEVQSAGVTVASANKLLIDTKADAQATFESTVATLKETLNSTVAARKKQAEKAAARLVGQLEKDNAADLADFRTAQTDAANDHFTEQTGIFVDWRSTDYGAQVTALTALNTATQIPWTQYLQDKAVCIAAWWADEGADLYTDWAADVNAEHSACTASVNAAYTTMVTTVADARDAYHDDTPEADDPGGDPDGDPPGKLPVKPDPAAAAAAAQQIAEAKTDYQKALAAANLQLALDTDAAGTDQQALAAAQTAYDSTVAAALVAYQQSVTAAQGDRSVADAQSVDDYVDEVYGEDGAYQTWQDAVSGAEAAYKTAESSAKETRDKNLAALDAALEAALADSLADALELLAINYPSPWAARAAADARAKSDRVASEQAAQLTYDQAIATALGDFADTVAGAEQTRSEAQIDAVCALKTTLSEANLDKASDQKTADDAAAEDGASTKKPEEETPPDAPEDVTGTFGEGETEGFTAPEPITVGLDDPGLELSNSQGLIGDDQPPLPIPGWRWGANLGIRLRAMLTGEEYHPLPPPTGGYLQQWKDAWNRPIPHPIPRSMRGGYWPSGLFPPPSDPTDPDFQSTEGEFAIEFYKCQVGIAAATLDIATLGSSYPARTVAVPRLIHLTDEAGEAGIAASQQIIGRHGVFAVPEYVATEATAMRVVRTGLPPSRTTQVVPIPDAAVRLFQRPLPIGPYSGWKYLGEVYYASPGSISTATGAFAPSYTIIGPNMLIYGPDAVFYGVVGAGGSIYWYATSEEE